MDKKNIINIVVTAIIFTSLTYYFSPKKVEIKEVEKIVEVKGETKIIYKEKIKKITTKPDGTIIEEEVEKDLVKEEVVEEKQKLDLKLKTVTPAKKNWSASVGVMNPILNNGTDQEFYLQVNRKIVGNLLIGVILTSNKSYGVGLGFNF